MKYYFKTISVFLLFFFITSFIVNEQNKLKTGFYYLADKEDGSELIKDVDGEDTFAVDKREILTVNDFSDAKFVIRNAKPNPIKIIELKLTKVGRKKWLEIKNQLSSSGESVVFICNDKIYLEKTISGSNNIENSTIDLLIESKYQEEVIKVIKSEINDSR
ncbi:hypothetical protein [Flavobacterium sp.]|uniref:hypothetical protein n=1 Tax=Flavobacterium sp. TaxID=239 RepID=UPI0025E08105|nr:hypothetical protein [Flavobacterium sp.]